ncbi:Phosphoenolpyruvate-protein phosphotransferase OS=Tsukamurella paurometabola (strain ATCC 8368 / DSM / CCUG 35730 / CIP 100753 / JCM 10117 / KCTC 9821 /NBRC 16120 / NCIMB 702349 / NCTC 13040) OX=521096 GN=Tpau_0183 PE=3 SV=1 [Tsukamurella paurometabola]|uniref:Phosphoenolpyruvate-protein phosphotransferase n=1 Tax=Tsukamurella paurometabola (strain ATCC 8368 / DSM 20162 / CCUG 35730 / CIP 100753 / JCM 10117 / KCTC 9821 / NBRC 16120 / NCIMB 702349 / NCTC 13040) TaxID=521096 RepID=D5UQK4_TSUPD|nr:phosphoenolpyruvate--protein phosphotransferase [Tsukamurella paurometabola]ADG76837.1 phosphoenolpyruvate-protein phosphotransferase [Tsukamurella paurometabola DSM 20162]SUP41851.1 Phosphoenolpyruvate-protein phosphotransferase [Tsukamurella paurometabola]
MSSQQSTVTVLAGTAVVPGVAYAPVMWPGERPELPAVGGELPETERDAEAVRLSSAARTVAGRLRERASQATGAASEVLAATAGLASDKAWLSAAEKLIRSGSPAEGAVAAATEQFADMFTTIGGLMAERVTDLRDVRDRVLAELLGRPEPGVPTPTAPSVLLADDLAPADTAGLDPALVVGIGTRLGGPTSHTAIIARQLGIPCIVGLAEAGTVEAGTLVLLDGAEGTVTVAPPADGARARVAEAMRMAEDVARWRGPGRTSDGTAVAILANVQDGPSARTAAERQVEGVGLFRTELAFLNRADEPSVDEQQALYREVIDAFPAGKVVIRTLDAGSDKPLKFIDHGHEDNPALGIRGIRIAATDPGLLERQLDAIAAAATGAAEAPWVMAPMIATAAEARSFAAQCRARGLTPGVMIEVPAAALCAEAVLAEVDFVSVGTNDLTQYAMAADRMSSELAALTDPWQPAVLRLIRLTADAGAGAGKPVGVCGEAAADPLLACVLVGLGVTSLSCAAGAAAAVGARLGGVTLQQCRWAAEAAVASADPQAARDAARRALS